MRKKSPPPTIRAARPGLPGRLPWEDRLCRSALVHCGAVHPDRRRPSSGLGLARPGLLPRLCGLCETGVMLLIITDIEKGRVLAYKESRLSKKECARRVGRGVHCVKR